VLAGQCLNIYRLGHAGVFYGNRLDRPVTWCRAFPFSVLEHPQYVGPLLSIWGFFLVARFPYDDWYALPALETVYYLLGAKLESDGTPLGHQGTVRKIRGAGTTSTSV
jgi:methylene-fatty-acyl-phospholipid synthase